ncbi:MAG: nucleobase:cation symporter-2 family protein [Pseudomonadota bacterium]
MNPHSEILYDLDAKPPFGKSLTAAFQHVLASFVGIVTPTLVIGAALDLQSEIPYLISMALIISGVGTAVQAKAYKGIGSGLIALQGTSFAFLTAFITGGLMVKNQGGSKEDILAMLFGITFVGAFIEIFLSFFIHKIKRIITPLTTGIVITTIGISLIKVGATDIAGGYGAEDFGDLSYIMLGGLVLIIIITLNNSRLPWLRLSAIFFGIAIGYIVAFLLGLATFNVPESIATIALPVPFKYGFNFDWEIFIPVALIYFLSTLETAGDLTANSLFCRLPVSGEKYIKRIKSGIFADGINSMLAGMFNTFPNTTFGQNNAVIQMTGVTSRYIAYFIAAILILLGAFPILGVILQNIPKPVLGGATLVMFATIAVAGIKILSAEKIDRRASLIIATSFGLGFGTMLVPDALQQLPSLLRNIFSSAVSTAGLTAIIMTLILPVSETQALAEQSQEQS